MDASEELRPYVLGTSIGYGEGEQTSPVRGLQSAINWGSPVVQLEGSPAWVGRTGIRVIKELAKHNKVKLSWHAPPSKQWEFAYPDEETNELAARQFDLLLSAAKTTGTEVVNQHVTNVIPRIGDDKLLLYDEQENQVTAQRLPAHERKKLEEASSPEEIKEVRKDFIKMLNRERQTSINQQLNYHERLADVREDEMEKLKGIITSMKNYPEVSKDKFISELTPYKEQIRQVAQSIGEKGVDLESAKGREKLIKSLKEKKEKLEEEYKAEKERAEFLKERYEKPMKTGEFYSDGYEAVVNNFAKKFAPMAEKAIKKGIKISLENADSRYSFSSPSEVKDALRALYDQLKKKGYSEKKIKKHVGYCFDYGHANTISGLKIGGKTIGPPMKQIKKVTDEFPLMHVHYHENFGDVDAHMPVGESTKEGEDYDKKLKQLQKFLKEKKFKGDIVHEIGGLKGLGYKVSLKRAYPGVEYSASGRFTPGFSSPGFSYVSQAHQVDPIHLDKNKHYFYGSWAGGQLLP